MKDEHQVHSPGIQLGIVPSLEHKKEILGNGEPLLRMAYVQRAALLSVTEHIVGVGYDGRELAHQFNALTHKVFTGGVIRILIKGIEFQHAAGKYVHYIVPLQFDDVQKGILLQRHILHHKIVESLKFLTIWKLPRKQKIGHFLEAETFLLDDGIHNIRNLVPAEIQSAFYGLQASILQSFITDHIADICQPHEHSGSILVAQPPLHLLLLEQVCINLGAGLHLVRQLIYQIFTCFHKFS